MWIGLAIDGSPATMIVMHTAGIRALAMRPQCARMAPEVVIPDGCLCQGQ